MIKIALLVGVSEYESDFKSLASAAKDVTALQEVLENPNIGGFDQVATLINPNLVEMQEKIEILFANRAKDDLILLYFSGHGVRDEAGRLYFTTKHTRRNTLKATAMPASFVHAIMSDSRSQRQVVILDCCFSGAFAQGMSAKDDEQINVEKFLGGKGRAILTSSSSFEYSFEQKGAELSVYTHYLVEGLATGVADRNGHGHISVEDLHYYTASKVREASPAMTPEIYPVKEGYSIQLAKAPIGNPKLLYRREVERLAQERQGKFSDLLRTGLEEKCRSLGISSEDAIAIENEVLKPYREFEAKLQRYEEVLREQAQKPSFPTPETLQDLTYVQQTMGLRREHVATIEAKFLPQELVKPKLQDPTSPQKTEESTATAKGNAETAPKLNIERMSTILFIASGFLVFTTVALLVYNRFTGTTKKPSPQVLLPPSTIPSDLPTPASAEGFLQQGKAKYEQQDYPGAIDDYRQALARDPNYAEAHYHLGVAQVAQGKNEEAIASYTQAINLDPDFTEAYYNRGVARNNLNKYQEAKDDYDEAIKRNNYSEPFKVYYKRGLVKYHLGDLPGAFEDCSQAIKQKSNFHEAHYCRGITYHALKNFPAAISDYGAAISLAPENSKEKAMYYRDRGLARANSGNLKEAISDYGQAIGIDASNAEAYYYRGSAQYDLGNKQDAINDYTKAIDLKPEYAGAYYARGLARYDLRDIQGALDDYRQALNFKPDYAEVYVARGSIFLEQNNDRDGAIREYSQAIQENPNYAPAYEKRADVYTSKNPPGREQAIWDYQKAAELYKSQHDLQRRNRCLNAAQQLKQF